MTEVEVQLTPPHRQSLGELVTPSRSPLHVQPEHGKAPAEQRLVAVEAVLEIARRARGEVPLSHFATTKERLDLGCGFDLMW